MSESKPSWWKESYDSLERPNPHQSWDELEREERIRRDWVGVCYVWERQNSEGETTEVYCLDPYFVVPHPATAEYPQGYYQVRGHVYLQTPFLIGATDIIRLRKKYE